MTRHKLEFAIAAIIRSPTRRRHAMAIVKEEVLDELERAVAAGTYHPTPHRARVWHYRRPDGLLVPITEDWRGDYLP